MRSIFLLVFLLLTGCAKSSEIPVYSAVPDFSLTERSTRTVTKRDLDGKLWVADFIFTHCGGICPTMSENMEKLQARLPKEVMLVSFSVDPQNDTPEVLTEYAKRYNADPERWLFLTGDPGTMQKLSIEGFKLALDTSSGTEVEPITHSSRFVLVDRQGRMRGYYSMGDADTLDRIEAAVKTLF
jgi:cytochrome oxidase Cu insertion factor (SCO1/SenC/PrrC family)